MCGIIKWYYGMNHNQIVLLTTLGDVSEDIKAYETYIKWWLPSGKLLHNYGKPPFLLMGKCKINTCLMISTGYLYYIYNRYSYDRLLITITSNSIFNILIWLIYHDYLLQILLPTTTGDVQ